jgi:hypothetical protein
MLAPSPQLSFAGNADWPVYRHDLALTGTSRAKGKILKPEIKWEHYLGAAEVAEASHCPPEPANLVDLDGDGSLELLFYGGDGRLHAVRGKDGREVWSVPASGRPVVADIDGDGLAEVLTVGPDGVLRVVGAAGVAK